MAQPIVGGVTAKRTTMPSQQTFVRANPQTAITVFGQRAANIVHHFRSVRDRENGKANTIESRQAKAGSYPEISIPGLMNGLDRILRKTLLGFPGLKTVLPVRPTRWQQREELHGKGPRDREDTHIPVHMDWRHSASSVKGLPAHIKPAAWPSGRGVSKACKAGRVAPARATS